MKTAQPGCLSSMGIFSSLLVIILILAFGWMRGGALFNPGPLNAVAGSQSLGGVTSHAGLASNCAACHVAPWSSDTMAGHCLACHTDLTQDPKNFHRVMLAQSKTGATCRGCHTEHHGPSASLTVTDLKTFPHATTGFSLKAHQKNADGTPFACQDCHPKTYATFDQGICATCHRSLDASFLEAHQAAFGQNCLACHDGLDTYGKAFNHTNTAFPLQGKHAAVACAGCHSGAGTISQLKAAPQTCYACHQNDDAHQGQFGQDCGGCHNPADWKQATFDHSKTAFPLTGKHQQVACQDCHTNGVFKGTAQNCYACHQKDDAHQGQFGQDCGGCHTPVDWKQATFDHSKTSFPLTGAHLSVACQKCHTGASFKGTSTQCVSCHADPAFHQGFFGTSCSDCHTTQAWAPARFNRAHTFPINHGGARSCRDCHIASLGAYTCDTCHNQSDMKSRHAENGITDLSNCARCHPSGRSEGGGG